MNKDIYGLIGFPIKGSLSPMLFNAAYRGEEKYELIEDPSFQKCFKTFLQGPYRAVNVTAPFKADALQVSTKADKSAEACMAANILVKRGKEILAYNSDYLALRHLLEGSSDVAVVGGGGAGRAALKAAEDNGAAKVRLFHHDELQHVIESDTIVFTLPSRVEGIENLHCHNLIEANYKTPCCCSLPGVENYIPGTIWLAWQAILGYELMTGKAPDKDSILSAVKGKA